MSIINDNNLITSTGRLNHCDHFLMFNNVLSGNNSSSVIFGSVLNFIGHPVWFRSFHGNNILLSDPLATLCRDVFYVCCWKILLSTRDEKVNRLILNCSVVKFCYTRLQSAKIVGYEKKYVHVKSDQVSFFIHLSSPLFLKAFIKQADTLTVHHHWSV